MKIGDKVHCTAYVERTGQGISVLDLTDFTRLDNDLPPEKKVCYCENDKVIIIPFHEFTDATIDKFKTIEKEFDGIVNYNIAAKKRGDSITFLRKIVRGSTDDSYGIEVAKLAGLPNEVIKRAKEILVTVEESAKNIRLTDKDEKAVEKDDSLITFDDCMSDQVLEEIKSTDINTLSPYECMTLLFDWKKRLG